MLLKRKIYQQLLEWKRENNGKSAMLVKGARRVGKSFICQQFGKSEYRSMIFIDFSDVKKEIIDIFENDTNDFDLFLQDFRYLIKRSCTTGKA